MPREPNPDMTFGEFAWSQAPAAGIRRRFWIKVAVVYAWIGVLLVLGFMLERFLETNRLAAVLFGIIASASVIMLGVCWRFREPCPRCGWNLNLTNKPYLQPAIWVPSSCPNCGLDLRSEAAGRSPTPTAIQPRASSVE